MSFYRHYVFPHLLDLATSSKAFRKPRARTLAPARGRILEIGFGTGMNLRYYPDTVRRIEAIDPDLDLDRFSKPRIEASRIEVDFHHLDAEHLPFEAERFDTVVSTLTLCSIPDVVHALGEIRRVLKPGGQLLFLEHGRAPDASVARWQGTASRPRGSHWEAAATSTGRCASSSKVPGCGSTRCRRTTCAACGASSGT